MYYYSDGVVNSDEERIKLILKFCETARSRNEVMKVCGINSESYFRLKILNPLISEGKIKRTIPDKPNSPKQKYITVK